jgi:hypothetical protein
MHTHAGRAAVLGSVLLLVACQKSLPTAPSEVTSGITIYEHANFLGQSALVTQSITDLKDFKGPCRETTFNGTNTETTEMEIGWTSHRMFPTSSSRRGDATRAGSTTA